MLATGRENTNLVSLFDGHDLLVTRVPCLKSIDMPTCYLKNSKLSKSINAITCFVKEFIMLLNVKNIYFFKCIKQHDVDQIAVKCTESGEKKETRRKLS